MKIKLERFTPQAQDITSMSTTAQQYAYSQKLTDMYQLSDEQVESLLANDLNGVIFRLLDGKAIATDVSLQQAIQAEHLDPNVVSQIMPILQESIQAKKTEIELNAKLNIIQRLRREKATTLILAQPDRTQRYAVANRGPLTETEMPLTAAEQAYTKAEQAYNQALATHDPDNSLQRQYQEARIAKDEAIAKMLQQLSQHLSAQDKRVRAWQQYNDRFLADQRQLRQEMAGLSAPNVQAQITLDLDEYDGQNKNAARTPETYTQTIALDNYADLVISEALQQIAGNREIDRKKIVHVDSANALWLGTIVCSPGFADFTAAQQQQAIANNRMYEYYRDGLAWSLQQAKAQRKPNESIVFNVLSIGTPRPDGSDPGGGGHFEYFELRPIAEDPEQFILLNVNSTNSRANNSLYQPGDKVNPKPMIDLVHQVTSQQFAIGEVRCHCLYDQSDIACGVAATQVMRQRLLGTPSYPATTPLETLALRSMQQPTAITSATGEALTVEQVTRLQHNSLIANSQNPELEYRNITTRGGNAPCKVDFIAPIEGTNEDLVIHTTPVYANIMANYHQDFINGCDQSIHVTVSNITPQAITPLSLEPEDNETRVWFKHAFQTTGVSEDLSDHPLPEDQTAKLQIAQTELTKAKTNCTQFLGIYKQNLNADKVQTALPKHLTNLTNKYEVMMSLYRLPQDKSAIDQLRNEKSTFIASLLQQYPMLATWNAEQLSDFCQSTPNIPWAPESTEVQLKELRQQRDALAVALEQEKSALKIYLKSANSHPEQQVRQTLTARLNTLQTQYSTLAQLWRETEPDMLNALSLEKTLYIEDLLANDYIAYCIPERLAVFAVAEPAITYGTRLRPNKPPFVDIVDAKQQAWIKYDALKQELYAVLTGYSAYTEEERKGFIQDYLKQLQALYPILDVTEGRETLLLDKQDLVRQLVNSACFTDEELAVFCQQVPQVDVNIADLRSAFEWRRAREQVLQQQQSLRDLATKADADADTVPLIKNYITELETRYQNWIKLAQQSIQKQEVLTQKRDFCQLCQNDKNMITTKEWSQFLAADPKVTLTIATKPPHQAQRKTAGQLCYSSMIWFFAHPVVKYGLGILALACLATAALAFAGATHGIGAPAAWIALAKATAAFLHTSPTVILSTCAPAGGIGLGGAGYGFFSATATYKEQLTAAKGKPEPVSDAKAEHTNRKK